MLHFKSSCENYHTWFFVYIVVFICYPVRIISDIDLGQSGQIHIFISKRT